MRVKVIGDLLTIQGFNLAGISGWVVNNRDEALLALDQAKVSKDVGIVLVSDQAARLVRKEFTNLVMHSEQPLFVELPGKLASDESASSLRIIVEDAIGVRSLEQGGSNE